MVLMARTSVFGGDVKVKVKVHDGSATEDGRNAVWFARGLQLAACICQPKRVLS